ncbi:hypothetical protein S83_027936 [Arachis hypogaea]
MGERCDFLEEISTKRADWIIKVYVVRMWYGPPRPNSSEAGALEIALHDLKGSRIHCTIPKSVVRLFRPILSEGQLYSISSFIVQKNNMWMKCSSLQYRITLLQRSMVVHIPQPLFTFQPFTFRSIASILQEERLDQNFLFDVLAEVIGKEDPKDLVTKQGQESKRLGLLVEDLEKNSISCTLFGSLVDLIQPYLDGDKTEPLIVAFQLFRAKEWNGKISIQSSFDTSNIHINPNIKEAELFKKSLVDSTQGDSCFSSQRISHMSSSSYRSAIDELRKGICKVETIDSVLNASDVGFKWILCTIVDFDVGRNDWFFIACKYCHKKCKKIEERFECDHCRKKAVQVDLRYKLQAYVSDATGSMCVVLWDTEASQIVELSATKVRETYSQDDSDDSYPEVLKTALDMKLLLRINVKSSNLSGNENVYNVTKACLDEHLIHKYSQSVNEQSTKGLDNVTSLDCTTDVVYLGDDESVQGGQESVNESKTVTSSKGRAKRIDAGIIGVVAKDLESIPVGQLSSTKKPRLSIKKEKTL